VLGLGALLLLWLYGASRARSAAQPAVAPDHPEATHPDLRLSHADVLNRLKSHSTTHYGGLYNVMKGVTLAAVGLSLVNIVGSSLPSERGLLLLVALISVLISYNGEAIGQAIMHLHPTTIDVILPMALTVSLVFLVGLPGASEDLGDMPAAWFAAFGAWSLIAASLILSVASRLDTDLYAPELCRTVQQYRRRMLFDAICATTVGVVSLGFFVIRCPQLPEMGAPEQIFLAFVGIGLVGGLCHHEATRRELRRNLLTITAPIR
jgi:hypothetical protein